MGDSKETSRVSVPSIVCYENIVPVWGDKLPVIFFFTWILTKESNNLLKWKKP